MMRRRDEAIPFGRPGHCYGARDALDALVAALGPAAFAFGRAASDGELWKSTVTIIPSSPATMVDYIQAALNGQAQGRELPFVIVRKIGPGVPPGNTSGQIVGTTRFYEIRPHDGAVAIGYTWLAKSAQRTVVNTESKSLMLAHAWDVTRAEVTKTLILGLRLVIDNGAQEGIMLHNGVVDLTSEEIDSAFHWSLSLECGGAFVHITRHT